MADSHAVTPLIPLPIILNVSVYKVNKASSEMGSGVSVLNRCDLIIIRSPFSDDDNELVCFGGF